MPADITGTEIIEEDRATGRRALQFIPGPIFANIVLADEINRTPPKTQAALLEAMQEDRKSTRLNSSHANISYAVFCLKKQWGGTYLRYAASRRSTRSSDSSVTRSASPSTMSASSPRSE